MAEESGTPTGPDDAPGGSNVPPRRRRSELTPAERRELQRRARGREEPAARAAPRRRSGRRVSASRSRRRRARSRTILTALAVALAIAAVVAAIVASGLLDRARELVTQDDPTADDAAFVGGDVQPALALVTYDPDSGRTAAPAVAVLAVDRQAEQGTILLVPTGTVADVPGHGSSTVGEAFQFGQAPLLGVTIDNLLDVRLDGVAALTPENWATVMDEVGGFEVEVRSRLVAPGAGGGEEIRFEPGRQHLDGAQLAEYLTLRSEGETQLEALPRIQDVLVGLLDAVAEDSSPLTVVDEEVDATLDGELLRSLLVELAEARANDRLTIRTLPVTALGSGRDDLYRVDDERASELIEQRFAASRPAEAVGAGRTLQVLNGNGVPGIGEEVAERLQPGGYRTLLTGNADRFDHPTTLIIVYDDSTEQLRIAEDIRERLGTGEVRRSETPQSVVDVTIVVGQDFPPEPDG